MDYADLLTHTKLYKTHKYIDIVDLILQLEKVGYLADFIFSAIYDCLTALGGHKKLCLVLGAYTVSG